jgi:uroporphyrinogen decarboxylase
VASLAYVRRRKKMTKMNHRERVNAVLSHKQPDRIPIDLGSTRNSSIVVEGYERLKSHFNVQEENVLLSRMMRAVDVNEQILQALDIDTRGVFPATPPDIATGDRSYKDEWGVERVNPPGSIYYDQVSFPLSGPISINDIRKYPFPETQNSIRTKGLKERVKYIHEKNCAAVLNMPSGFVHMSQYLRGFEDWFTDIAGDRKLIEFLFDAVLDVNLSICRAILQEVGNEVDVLLASDDLGFQDALMMSPQAYRELIKPRHRKYFQLMHEMSPAKVLFHTCGSVADIIEDLIEIGVDAIHPVQVSAAGMEPRKLKDKYGDRLAFWGGVDTQHVLPRGNIDEVKSEVERRIEELGDNGGYILCAVHNIQPDVPLDNVLTMYQHAKDYVL